MMDIPATLAQSIQTAGDQSGLDAACKRLLSEKIILAWIMKGCLSEYTNMDISQIAADYIEGSPQISTVTVHPDTQPSRIQGQNTEDSTMTEGTVTYDIRFHAIAPSSGEMIRLFINVEAQNSFYPGYPIVKRAIYYCSRMISSQYGTEFANSHYDDIKKVYSIWICQNPPLSWANSINRYFLCEESICGSATETPQNYDLLTAIIIGLDSSGSSSKSKLIDLLSLLLSNSIHPDEKLHRLESDFQISTTQQIESEVTTMCNLGAGIAATAAAQGLQQGVEQATLDSIKALCQNLVISVPEALQLLNISETDWPKYLEQLT